MIYDKYDILTTRATPPKGIATPPPTEARISPKIGLRPPPPPLTSSPLRRKLLMVRLLARSL